MLFVLVSIASAFMHNIAENNSFRQTRPKGGALMPPKGELVLAQRLRKIHGYSVCAGHPAALTSVPVGLRP